MDRFESPSSAEQLLSEAERVEVYERLAERVIDIYPERVFAYKGSGNFVMKVGNKTENNIEVATFFEYDKETDSHTVRQLTVVVNETEPADMELSGLYTVKSNYLVCSSSRLIGYYADYYIYDPVGDIYMLVYSSEDPRATAGKFHKIGKKLKTLNTEFDKDMNAMNRLKIEELLGIFNQVLKEDGHSYQQGEDSDESDEGPLYD